ncbi:MAG: transcription termination factor Rho [Verrucomicrobiota bacterium]|nr:transcription termination factor Rho [Verrucomicrobiota bacterium]
MASPLSQNSDTPAKRVAKTGVAKAKRTSKEEVGIGDVGKPPAPTIPVKGSILASIAVHEPKAATPRKVASRKKVPASTGEPVGGKTATPAEAVVSPVKQVPPSILPRAVEQNELPFDAKKPVAPVITPPIAPVIATTPAPVIATPVVPVITSPVPPKIVLPKFVDVPESYSTDSDEDFEPKAPDIAPPIPEPIKPIEPLMPAQTASPAPAVTTERSTPPAPVSLPENSHSQERTSTTSETREDRAPLHPDQKSMPPKTGAPQSGDFKGGPPPYKKDYPKQPFMKPGKFPPKPGHGGGYDSGPAGGYQGNQAKGYAPPSQKPGGPKPGEKPAKKPAKFGKAGGEETMQIGGLLEFEPFQNFDILLEEATAASGGGAPVNLNQIIALSLPDLITEARKHGVQWDGPPSRQFIFEELVYQLYDAQRPLMVDGILEIHEDGYGILVYTQDNYKIKPLSTFVAEPLLRRFGLKRGHAIRAQVHPPREGESCPFVLKIESVMGLPPESIREIVPFEDLTPYYPTKRMLLETGPDVKWDNFSMRIVDLLTPIGRGQRGLIVAPPRTGKTVLQQGIANAIVQNNPDVHLIVLLVDERPEEVTDFRRQITKGEVIASTFDQNAESHVHCAEMVLEKARRLVEAGQHVCILLDSITRLARAYNTLAANSGKILSGGVEASALQKPKRFFGSARNIEGAGSLTIIGTALVETGSRMDEVIFEEFKGTGNSELHLDRGLSDKRIFPAIAMERSGTRKEELLYHPDEMLKIYALRRAMKGVPPVDAMEMLITRVRKTRSNAEFLMGLNR